MRARILLVCLLIAVSFGQSPPATMTKLVVRFQSPEVPENSFAAQPKTMYRAGTRYCRIEELPDAEHGIHGVVVINEPDVWLVNLLDKTAQHLVDSGPTLICRLPLFADESNAKAAADVSSQLSGLEFGRELQFFRERKAASNEGPTLQGKATKAYILDSGDSQLLLFTAEIPERPVAVVRQRGTKRETYWYASYDDVPFDAKLFAKPEFVKIEDVKK